MNFPPLIRDGKIVGLLVDSPRRSPLFPDVPTLLELGYTEKLNRNYVGFVVPSATPPMIVNRLHEDITAVMNDPTFRQQQLIDRALEPAIDTPAEFGNFLDEDRVSFDLERPGPPSDVGALAPVRGESPLHWKGHTVFETAHRRSAVADLRS